MKALMMLSEQRQNSAAFPLSSLVNEHVHGTLIKGEEFLTTSARQRCFYEWAVVFTLQVKDTVILISCRGVQIISQNNYVVQYKHVFY